jgi:hypothetical protein
VAKRDGEGEEVKVVEREKVRGRDFVCLYGLAFLMNYLSGII